MTGVLFEVDAAEIDWHNRQGTYTTPEPLSYVDSIEADGLSRVYKIYANTIDSSRLDINHLLPLWSGTLPADGAAALAKLAMDERHFWRPNGLTMVSASDPDFDPSNARGGGGIWMYWQTLIGEGLHKSGYRREATDLVKRALEGLCRILERDGHLSQFYHADESRGFGEDHHIGGIAPLQLLQDVIGIRIASPLKVWVGGPFTWGEAVSVSQHGVTVSRNEERIQVSFPSGHDVILPGAAGMASCGRSRRRLRMNSPKPCRRRPITICPATTMRISASRLRWIMATLLILMGRQLLMCPAMTTLIRRETMIEAARS